MTAQPNRRSELVIILNDFGYLETNTEKPGTEYMPFLVVRPILHPEPAFALAQTLFYHCLDHWTLPGSCSYPAMQRHMSRTLGSLLAEFDRLIAKHRSCRATMLRYFVCIREETRSG